MSFLPVHSDASERAKFHTALAKKVAKKTLAFEKKSFNIGDCAVSKNPKNDFRTDGVQQAPNGSEHSFPAGRTLRRPVGTGIGRHRMAYRSVDEDFWRSPHLIGLDFQTKAVYGYLITQAGTSGFIYRTEGEHCALLELDQGVWRGVCQALGGRGRIQVDSANHLIWVCNQFKWQYRGYKKVGESQDKGLRNELEGLPQTQLLAQFVDRYRDTLEKLFPETIVWLRALPTPRITPQPTPLQTPMSIAKHIKANQIKEKDKDSGETPQNFAPIKEAFTKAETEQNKAGLADIVDSLSTDMAFPKESRYPPKKIRTMEQQQLDEWIEKARAVYRRIFGKNIKPAQVCLLAYGRNGKRINCFGEIDILIKFWESLAGQKIEDSFTWSLGCAKNRETVERFTKLV